MIILEWILNSLEEYALDQFRYGYESMGGYCKCAYKTLDSITDGEFLVFPNNYQVLKAATMA